jgi:putative phage-type endonuclease
VSESAFTIGGSDAAAACGIDPFRSRVMLWAEKTGRFERAPTEAMEWGTRLQPILFEALREQGYDVTAGHDEFTDSERPWLIGHTDGFECEPVALHDTQYKAVVEVKTANGWAAHDWRDGEAPARYVVQCQHYLHLTGLDRALLAVLIAGQRLETRIVERDDDLIALMLEAETEMYGYLVRDECPPFDGSDSAAAVLAAMYPEAVPDKRVRADKALMEHVRDYRIWHEAETTAKAKKAVHAQAIQAAMADAEVLLSPGDAEVATWKGSTRTALDQTRLKNEAPHIHKTYSKTTSTRLFKVA